MVGADVLGSQHHLGGWLLDGSGVHAWVCVEDRHEGGTVVGVSLADDEYFDRLAHARGRNAIRKFSRARRVKPGT